MVPEVWLRLTELAGLIAIGSFVIIWTRIWRGGHGRDKSIGEDVRKLQEEIRTLQFQLDGTQHDVAELEERLDFAERMLTQGREGSRLDAPHPTPV